MMLILKYTGLFVGLLISAVLAVVLIYGGKGYRDALLNSDTLRLRADRLIAQARGASSLGEDHLRILLKVEDPNFWQHPGVDFSSPGAGATTITQSASKRLAFKEFRPGFGKIRQTGYALGLERRLSKEQILALWLETLQMGNGPGGWMTGFHHASSAIFGRAPSELSKAEFIRLVAVLIAPAQYDLARHDAALDERVGRIERLVAGTCTPSGHGDVWLEGCRQL